ncbi:MAG: hypothetical protein WCX84_06225 [Syntrophales bacterium]|jgi:hypothetical protein|nr:hypothetical protein [Syntrophales bacterium]
MASFLPYGLRSGFLPMIKHLDTKRTLLYIANAVARGALSIERYVKSTDSRAGMVTPNEMVHDMTMA